MNKEKRQTYGLMTAVSMIVGVVIGSGIYFKADDILLFAGGHLNLALLSLVVASSGIVFGCLSLSELAQRTTASGGISHYMEHFVSPRLGAALGFFQAFVYFPSVSAIVSWVAAIYTAQLAGVDWSLEVQIAVAIGFVSLLFVTNLLSRTIGGWIQSLSTTVKVLPLLFIAVIGLFWSDPQPVIPTSYSVVAVKDVGFGWLSALVPLAFAYDGWSIVAAISPEVKQPSKNLPRAFFIGPMIILSLYMLYIYGISKVLGESYVMSVGNDAVQHLLKLLLHDKIVTLFMVVIIISVLGVANGLMLGNMRLPQAFAERGWLKSESLARIHPTYQLSVLSSVLIYGVTVFWLLMHYVSMKYHLLANSDISEISIVFNAVSLIILYVTVWKLYRKKVVTNRLTGLIAPILASLGNLMLLLGSLLTNAWQVLFFLLFCLVTCLVGDGFYRRNQASIDKKRA